MTNLYWLDVIAILFGMAAIGAGTEVAFQTPLVGLVVVLGGLVAVAFGGLDLRRRLL